MIELAEFEKSNYTNIMLAHQRTKERETSTSQIPAVVIWDKTSYKYNYVELPKLSVANTGLNKRRN